MNQIVMNLTLDLAENESRKSVRVVQGDAGGGKFVLITLTNNGEVVEITEEADEAKFYAGINGELIANGTPVAISGNKIHIPININCTSRAGTVNCTVRIESSSGIAHSAKFDIIVASNPAYYDVPASSTGVNIYYAVDSLTSRMTAAENDIDTLEGQFITLIGRATQLETTTSELTANLANYVKWTLTGMFRGWVRTDRTVTGSSDNTLLEDSPYYLIEKTYFDPDKRDGVMIWKNTTELVPPAWYSFDTETYENEGKVKIDFHTNDDESYFTASDRFYFAFYKNPAPLAMWTGTQAQYDTLASYDTNTLYIIEEASS